MSHRKFEHPRHGSLGFLPRKRAARHRGKGIILFGFDNVNFISLLLETFSMFMFFNILFACFATGSEGFSQG